MPLTEDTWEGILAAFVLLSFALLLILVPHGWLRPAAVGGLLTSAITVLGTRQYLRRLHGIVEVLCLPEHRERSDRVDAFLHPVERALLGLDSAYHSGRAVNVLRWRQAQLVSFGMAWGVVGIISFLLLVYLYDL